MKKTIEVELPTVPNFVRQKGKDTTIPLDEFSIEELEQMGKEWTQKLIERRTQIMNSKHF